MTLAIFDFDGTITTKDSLPDFIKFAIGKHNYYFGLFCLSPILFAYLLKLIPNHIAKEKLFSYFFNNFNLEDFEKIGNQYALKEIDKIVRPGALKRLNMHKEKHHKIVIVSASIDYWLTAWCKKNNYDLICTKIESIDNKLTGKFSTKNCYGVEKVNRLKEVYDLDNYDYIFAYGDSKGDTEMLKLANESFFKPFR